MENRRVVDVGRGVGSLLLSREFMVAWRVFTRGIICGDAMGVCRLWTEGVVYVWRGTDDLSDGFNGPLVQSMVEPESVCVVR